MGAWFRNERLVEAGFWSVTYMIDDGYDSRSSTLSLAHGMCVCMQVRMFIPQCSLVSSGLVSTHRSPVQSKAEKQEHQPTINYLFPLLYSCGRSVLSM
jgi:hypothetical protein